ncbi:unnamed protein product [Prorocentrum cordatum]|uniref:Tetratricopeptide repeat protein 38 n=1 Tax=Prorocentrum cordatum TaxID=2364126 RepID=A0ABN9Y326_9DINO|nr:unnamed protein product [Polarella glacialis]
MHCSTGEHVDTASPRPVPGRFRPTDRCRGQTDVVARGHGSAAEALVPSSRVRREGIRVFRFARLRVQRVRTFCGLKGFTTSSIGVARESSTSLFEAILRHSARLSYCAGISACRKGEQWQRALALLSEMWEVRLEPDLWIFLGFTLSACGKGGQWQPALALLSETWEAKLEPDVISYDAGIIACEKGVQWQRALALPSESSNPT